MSDYTQNTSFTAKDSLPSGTPAKKILGTELDAEFSEIATAISTKMEDSGALSTVVPDINADHIVINDNSTASTKLALMSAVSPIPGTVVVARGGAGQTSSGWAELNVFTSTTYDVAAVHAAGTITPALTEEEGLWLMYGKVRISSGIAAGDIIRLSVTRFNSAGVAQSRQYIEQLAVATADNMLQVIGAHYLTVASGDYMALEVFSNSASWSVNTSTLNMLVAFKLFA